MSYQEPEPSCSLQQLRLISYSDTQSQIGNTVMLNNVRKAHEPAAWGYHLVLVPHQPWDTSVCRHQTVRMRLGFYLDAEAVEQVQKKRTLATERTPPPLVETFQNAKLNVKHAHMPERRVNICCGCGRSRFWWRSRESINEFISPTDLISQQRWNGANQVHSHSVELLHARQR